MSRGRRALAVEWHRPRAAARRQAPRGAPRFADVCSPAVLTKRGTIHAITRGLSPAIARCELTRLAREPIDYARAVAQHDAYLQLLASVGVSVTQLPAEPDFPDAVFIEDTCVVLDELAVLTHPGAPSRRVEIASVERALRAWRPIARIVPPGTLDGGDVLSVGRSVYVGLSTRSNLEGAAQLRRLLTPFDYQVETVEVHGCLHLKSAVTAADTSLLLINPAWCDRGVFGAFDCIETAAEEPLGANVLRLEDSVILDAAFPRTAERLRERGVVVHTVDMSELAKAEGAVTCCSLVFAA
jgi:dimethylargininase